jgi:hypothetical protein
VVWGERVAAPVVTISFDADATAGRGRRGWAWAWRARARGSFLAGAGEDLSVSSAEYRACMLDVAIVELHAATDSNAGIINKHLRLCNGIFHHARYTRLKGCLAYSGCSYHMEHAAGSTALRCGRIPIHFQRQDDPLP